jgi:uncharacterized protein YhaN
MKHIHSFDSFLNEQISNQEVLNEREHCEPKDIRVDPEQASGIERAYTQEKDDGERKKGDKLWTVGDYRLANVEGGNKLGPFIVAAVGKVYSIYKSKHSGKDALDCASSMISAAVNAEKKNKNPIEAIENLIKRWEKK